MIDLIAVIVFFLVIAICSAFYFTRSMHIFQLNSYKLAGQFKWFRQNIKWIALNTLVPLTAVIFFIMFFRVVQSDNSGTETTFAFTLFVTAFIEIIGAFIFGRSRTKAKKPLVFTHRVIRMYVTGTIVFLAAGFAYIYACLLFPNWETALIAVPFFPLISLLLPIIANIINAPVEKLNNSRYINQTKNIINSHPNLMTIGITGSYGKTSTKYYLHKLLSVKFNTLMTPESYNTTLGVVKTVRNDLRATHEVFVCEMGAKYVGDIKEICDIVKPQHSMITSIGPQHLETFKSIENIIRTKFEIADSINDGIVFLNYDNDYIKKHKTGKNIISYGVDEAEADFRASGIKVSEKGTDFTVTSPGGETARFSTPLIGAHNVQNILGAIAVANTLGIEMKALIPAVKRLEPVPHRLQILNKGGAVIIDDAFNSNPVGAKAALDVLKMFNGIRFLITPGMVELGEKEYELNKEFGAYAAVCCDFAVLIGERQAVPIRAGLLESGFPESKIKIFKTVNEGLDFTHNYDSGIPPGTASIQKIILLENDLPDNY